MPRKSSFLQGFEVGSALYSRGYQQATQRRQMQLGEDRDKRLEAQQKLEFGLRKDAAKLRKQQIEMSVSELARKQEKDKLALRNESAGFDAILNFKNDLNEGDIHPDESAEDYRIAQNIGKKYLKAIAVGGPKVDSLWRSWWATTDEQAGKQAINLNRAASKAGALTDAQITLTKKTKDAGTVSDFNNQWDTTYTSKDIALVHRMKRNIGNLEQEAARTGTYAINEDYPFYDALQSHLDTKTRLYQADIDKAGETAAAAQRAKVNWERKRGELANETKFNEWREAKGYAHLKWNDPASMKAYRTSTQRGELMKDIDWDKVGVAGQVLLAGLQSEEQGGYSDATVAGFRAAMSKYESGETRRRIPKTEAASKGVLYSEVMLFNNTVMEEIERRGEVPGTADFWNHYLKAGVLGSLGNYFMDDMAQRYKNSADNFIAGVLRKESGAAITTQERADYWPQYIPVPGDLPGVLAQKRAARKNFLENTRLTSGMKWADTEEVRVSPPPIPWANKAVMDQAIQNGMYEDGEPISYYDGAGTLHMGAVDIPEKKDED